MVAREIAAQKSRGLDSTYEGLKHDVQDEAPMLDVPVWTVPMRA